nr:hypothetical protein [Chloroflexota bacterium]
MDGTAIKEGLAELSQTVREAEERFDSKKNQANDDYEVSRAMIESSDLSQTAKSTAIRAVRKERDYRITQAERVLDSEVTSAEHSFREKARESYASDDELPFA